jgi:nitrate reductase NapA
LPSQTRRDILKALALGAALATVGKAAKLLDKQLEGEIKSTVGEVLNLQGPAKMTIVPIGPCRFCGTGCGVQAMAIVDPNTGLSSYGKVYGILGMPGYPVNHGAMCTKAFYIHKAMGWANPDAWKKRLRKPMVNKDWIIPGLNRPPIKPEEIPLAPRVKNKQVTKNVDAKIPIDDWVYGGNYVEVDWDTAVKFFTAVFKYALQKYGPHSFAYYGSGQLGTEESYVINKLTKGGIHTNNLDGNPRMCMVSAVGGYITSFGADEPETSYDLIDVPEPNTGVHADTFLLIGTNTAEAHPIVFGRIARVKEKLGDKAKIILADPRKTRTGVVSDLWLPLRWSMDVAFMNTLIHILLFRLAKCKADPQTGKVECENPEYIDITWLKRHADFAILKQSQKTWALKNYNTKYNNLKDLNKVWDMGTTASVAANYSFYPSVGKKYNSDEDIEKDWWKGFALFVKFFETYKPEVMVKLLFGDEKPLIKRTLAQKLIASGELDPAMVNMSGTDPFVEIDPVKAMELAAKWLAEGKPLIVWTMGINQKIQGVHSINAIIDFLALAGKIGKYGSGTLSLTGQPNACGGIRDQGGLAHVLPYGRLIANAAARHEVEEIWRKVTAELMKDLGYPQSVIEKTMKEIYVHPVPGPHVIEMFRRVNAGQLKVVWIAETNPGQSLPNLFKFRVGMAKPHDDDPAFPFVVVSDIYPTRTTDVADLILPASAYGEKEFFYGCTERRYSVARYLVHPPGDAIGDHIIFAMLGKAWEDEGLVPKGIVSVFFPERVDEAAKKAGMSWVEYVVKKSQDLKWHMKVLDRIWNYDIRALAKNTYYDFSYPDRALFRKRTWQDQRGFRWPWPWTYAYNPSVKKRYDEYESAMRYAYPYDPLMPDPEVIKDIYNKIKDMNDPEEIHQFIMNYDSTKLHPIHKKKWLGKLWHNPALLKWVMKNIVEEIDDMEYKKKHNLPSNWYNIIYPKPTGRMTMWTRPWIPVNMDHKTGQITINKTVIITHEQLDADAVFKGKISVFPAPKGPFKITYKTTAVPADGDPERGLQILEQMSWDDALAAYKGDITAIFEIALAPAEAPGFTLRYRTADGEVITVRKDEGYPLVATTGRVIEHWHTCTMTCRVPELFRVKPSAYVEINVELANKLGIRPGDWVVVESPRGKVVVPARVLNPKIGLGGPRKDYLFIPWFDPNKLANALTLDNYDVQPYFFQPDFKTCAARIRKAKPNEIPPSITSPKQTASANYDINLKDYCPNCIVEE